MTDEHENIEHVITVLDRETEFVLAPIMHSLLEYAPTGKRQSAEAHREDERAALTSTEHKVVVNLEDMETSSSRGRKARPGHRPSWLWSHR